jgi:RNA polymerase sigma-32 factor
VRASPDRKEYLEDGEVKPQVFLLADEERDLARRYRQGDEKAGHQLACAYLPLVKRIAAEFFGSWEDLVQEGFVGLMKAVRGYDPDHGARLGTYAYKWIEAEIREYTKSQVRREDPQEDEKPKVRMDDPNGQANDDNAKKPKVRIRSLSVPSVEAAVDMRRWQMGECEDQEQALANAQEWRLRRELLKRALNSLSDPERQIIVERHLRHQATPLKDLGARFGLSGESIRQIELKALKTMKGMAAA